MLKIKRIDKIFKPDFSRVITRLHIPGGEERIINIIKRVANLSDKEVDKILENIIAKFAKRHKNIWNAFDKYYNEIKSYIPEKMQLSDPKRALLGAYFSLEYSVQAAAFFNPSIVPHPSQSNLPKGSLRFIISFRSIGEGHVSSIEFRSGVVDNKSNFTFDKVSPYVERATIVNNPVYDKKMFYLKLQEMQINNDLSEQVLGQLADNFLFSDLEAVIRIFLGPEQKEISETMLWLARSNYELQFKLDQELSERIIFPGSQNDSNGIEDARFVKFIDDNDKITYYATYTAYNGLRILPQILETKDFLNFKIMTLNGKCAVNKGMALFPRKINNQYMMISRIDGENLYIMSSENIHFWQNAKRLREPENPWEFVQIGNCGSPIETEEGWLVLIHGVGPIREYCIGAILLDLDAPEKVIGSMREPLLVPTTEEREGYVPNVVYSCGAMIHNGELILPYAVSDTCSKIATVSIKSLLDNILKKNRGELLN
jgi:predicted GH43/DUF377 family glycosyl hydrolase